MTFFDLYVGRVLAGLSTAVSSLFGLFLLAAICSQLSAQTTPDAPFSQLDFHDDTWHVSISPYLWLAGMNGSIGFGGHAVKVDQSFTDIFGNLKFGVMGFTEVRRGRIGFLTDLMYVRLGDETAVPVEGLPSDVNVKASLNTFTLTPYFGYRILGSDRGAIDWLSGGRYYHIRATISANAGAAGNVSYSASNNWADFVQGGRFTLRLTRKINTYFMGDAGGGGSVLTWQIVGGAGYKLSKRWSTQLGYRRLYFNRQTSKGFGLEQTQQGLILGATFRMK